DADCDAYGDTHAESDTGAVAAGAQPMLS
ncbi:MAG: hypothetical protein QOF71_1081, partial [Candidatus Eremiobacteraeota bacterium]|nr:hypothetical protein [Candidatus Eremiobacteraeota bacterium]